VAEEPVAAAAATPFVAAAKMRRSWGDLSGWQKNKQQQQQQQQEKKRTVQKIKTKSSMWGVLRREASSAVVFDSQRSQLKVK
jgi:hypothetical protein